MENGFERKVEMVDGAEVAKSILWHNSKPHELSAIDPSTCYPIAREWLRLRLQDPCSAVAKELDRLPAIVRAKAEEKLWDRAFAKIQFTPDDRVVTREDVVEWLDNSEDGADMTLLFMLMPANPEFADLMANGKTLEAIRRVGAMRPDIQRAEFNRLRDEINAKMVREIKSEAK